MRRKRLLLILLDLMAINYSYILALFLRFEGNIPASFLNVGIGHFIIISAIKIGVFYALKLYGSIWEYASIDELVEIVGATVFANILTMIYTVLFMDTYSLSLLAIITLLEIGLIGGIRFVLRAFRRVSNGFGNDKNPKRVIIVGAGAAGVMTLKEIRNHRELYSKPVAFIDDDPTKLGRNINGIPILGSRKDIVKVCDKNDIDEIIIAIPSAEKEDIKEIIKKCKKTRCKTKILPGMYELLDGKLSVSQIRDVQIEDLLGREEVSLNLKELSNLIEGKRVMVTGGGGSIGSELCRQVARYAPDTLMILDVYENNAYDLQNELLKDNDNLNLKVLIASVVDNKCIDEIIERERPEIVFHAAAHKHVPLMEDNPKSAIKNNVFGTLNMVRASCKYGVSKFVMISTDKAVNPTNVMGATKRICEMIIQAYNSISDTDFVAVRFGNVLGSNGSVIPLFKKQIEEGGPITVTDERIVRFFMTIPEACQLVLQAGSMASGGEIFVLDMGQAVKIVDLARDLIQLSGFEPDVDIKIKFTGLRPGEKLYEEILLNKEEMTETSHEKIYIEKPMNFKHDDIMRHIELLNESLESKDRKSIRDDLQVIVPSYHPYVPNEEAEKIKKECKVKEGYDEEYNDVALSRYIS